ncbi:helix-turn-helix transcriptional regulator [Bacillus sp. 1P06AnD]|uniref:helix-turn-helix transcriptional regulator n=1 Tax=Bacillus sp. 1P06AnD TaxID=3132208 RepID=UPI0039A36135
MSKVSNCLHMLNCLNSRGVVKIQELEEMLEVNERMIRKYKDEIEMAGIHIGSKRGKEGGYYLEKTTLLPNMEFQEKELNALDMAYDLIKNDHSFAEFNAFKRMYFQIASTHNHSIETNPYIYFIHKYKPRDTLTKDNENFLELRSAIIQKRKVVFSYQGWRGIEETRKVHPHGLVHYDGNWYCCGFCELRGEQRTFKLLRIQHLEVTEENFERDGQFNIRQDKIGICDDVHNIELHVFPPYAHTISEAVWGEKQEIIDQDDGSVSFRATMSGKESIIKWILGMGSAVHVLGPAHIRQAVKDELIKTIEYYQ